MLLCNIVINEFIFSPKAWLVQEVVDVIKKIFFELTSDYSFDDLLLSAHEIDLYILKSFDFGYFIQFQIINSKCQ